MTQLVIFTDKIKAQAYSDKIHEWLKVNRKDYRADRWSNVEETKDETGLKFYVKVPSDYEVLNEKMPIKDRLTLPTKAVIAEKLPADWRRIEIETKDFLTKGLGLFNYSKPVTNFRGEKVGRWSLVKDLLKELWRRIKNLF
ncbi:MAG: hypothetical protein BWY21_02104 [Parcubacteria group bacterium ADurb.Bin216]|nr:MAG: hypothetical protein BWY21_02104 [Parcubacteria group bacterium ADurb.Bin216]